MNMRYRVLGGTGIEVSTHCLRAMMFGFVGCSLPELAIAFPLAHPAVASVIIGPRTMEQLEQSLKGASLSLDDAALDRIDEIVPPGTDVYNPNQGVVPRSLTDPGRRRRPLADRAAA
jgi:hypothetical protein